jgi:hypothetical protein
VIGRFLLLLLIGILLGWTLFGVLAPTRADADDGWGAAGGWTDADVSAALTQASSRYGVSRGLLRCIAAWETGFTFDPYTVGDGGLSLGEFQLYRYGLLPTFYAEGWTDPFDPYESAAFTASWIARHGAGAWSPVRLGYCR